MTIIAFDGKTVAADRLAIEQGHIRHCTKLFRAYNGAVLAMTGDASHGMSQMAWYNSGAAPDKFPRSVKPDSWAAMWVFQVGRKPLRYENGPVPVIYEDKTVSDGSGCDAAKAVMLMGGDARTAVAIASQVDIHCGGGVDFMEVNGDAARSPEPAAARPATAV